MADWLTRLRAACTSLTVRITAGAIALLVAGIGLATVLLVQQADADTLAAEQERELRDAVRTAEVLSQRVIELQRALQVTAARLDAATLADPLRLAAFMDGNPVLRGLFSNLFAATPDGRMQVYADAAGTRHPGIDVSDRDYFRRTVAEQRAIVSAPLPGRVSGEPVIIFTYPLRNADGLYGVLGGALRLASRDLLAMLVGEPKSESEALVVVTDAEGRILAHPLRERVAQSIAVEPALAAVFAQWRADGGAVEPAGLRMAAPLDMVSAAGVAGPDWMVWRVLPRAEVLAPLHAARRHTLLWAAGLVGLMSLALWRLLRHLLQPLLQLEHRAQHLFDNAQDPLAGWPAAGGEIGRVSRVLRRVGAERAQLEARNAQVLQQLGSVMSAAPVGILFTRDQRFELVSAECCRLFGRSEAQLLGQPARIIYASNADYDELGPKVRAAFVAGESYVGEHSMLRADGTLFWARLRGRPVDHGDPAAGTIWTLNDIGEQLAVRERLQWSASHDTLTGLGNRRAFEQALQRVFATTPRTQPAALVMIDLDHFKPINDSAGHAAGDAMLVAVAAAICSAVRTNDLVVRLGGDEFGLLLENCGQDDALRVAAKVRAAIAAISLPWEGRSLGVGASLGVVALGGAVAGEMVGEMADPKAWVGAADAACYADKASGRASGGAARPALRVVA